MDLNLFKKLHAEGLITTDSLEKIETVETKRLFSLYRELKTLLYLGVLILTGGLGILVYKNIDTIGHQFILLFIALVTTGCFYYCFRKKLPFSLSKVEAPHPFFDYILLLGCLSLLIFIAYLQFQYGVFGYSYGLATFIPMVILFACAYYFDHAGILSLAITNLAAWLGITVTPMRLLRDNDFSSSRIICTGLGLGLLLLLAALASRQRKIKEHFAFTYNNFSLHILFISGLAGLFTFHKVYIIWFAGIVLIAWYFYRLAFTARSFYFLLAVVIYVYIALSYVVIDSLDSLRSGSEGAIYLGFIYFIVSAFGLIRGLMFLNRKLKLHDRL